MTSIDETYLDIEGVNLEYRLIGNPDPDSPTLVFLHEGLGSVAMWKDFPDQVAVETGLSALIYSRQSYGKSDPLPEPRDQNYLRHEASAVLPQVLAAVEIQHPVLIGHSDGASIALLYAGDEKLAPASALVLMAPHVFCEDMSISGIEVAKEAYEKHGLRERLALYHKNVDNAFWRWNDIWLEDDFIHWNIESCLSNIDVPLLCIQGKQDEYGSEAQVRSIEAKCRGPVQVSMLEDCRHSPHKDQNKLTLDGIKQFLQQQHLN